jgi:hypothetical protein
LTDSTSQRIVYSILTRSREYSNAIHCTPLLSCRTTRGVVAGMGPGAALELVPNGDVWWTLPACRLLLPGEGRGGFSIGRWADADCEFGSIFMMGLLDSALEACDCWCGDICAVVV